MISNIDIDIYQALLHEKKLTEKYIGKVEFSWVYSEVYYTAECTVGVPFDLFDKVVVGLLRIEDTLSLEQIGEILGMNVVHNPDKHQYRDDAEYDILRMALDSLKSYGVIETGDIYYSRCQLTKIGKEYAQKGRKFKIERNKSFSLIYDHTSGNHLEAKKVFGTLKGTGQNSLLNGFDFLDENLMKQLAIKQAIEVYNPEIGNSFTSAKVDHSLSHTFKLKIYVAIIYDLDTKTTRLAAFEPSTKSINQMFSDWLNVNVKEQVLLEYKSLNISSGATGTLPENVAKLFLETKKDFPQIINEPEKAKELIHQAYIKSSFIDFPYFWVELSRFITDELKEMWFFLPEVSLKELQLLIELVKQHRQTPIFITLKSNDYPEDIIKMVARLADLCNELDNQAFFAQVGFKNITGFSFWNINVAQEKSYELKAVNFELDHTSGIIINGLHKVDKPITTSYSARKAYFASITLPYIEQTISGIIRDSSTNKIINKQLIESYQDLDVKGMPFIDILENQDITEYLHSIAHLKNSFLLSLKASHKKALSAALQDIFEKLTKQELDTLEKVNSLSKQIEKLKSDFLPEYQDLLLKTKAFLDRLLIEEKRIKDEVLSKTYVIDTNVFIDDPEVLRRIEEKHTVVVSQTVISELDKLKQNRELRDKAAKAISNLNKALGKVKRLRTAKPNLSLLPEDYRHNLPDNRILSVASMYKEKNRNPVLLTTDNGLQLKAKSIDIPTLSLREFIGPKENPKVFKRIDLKIDYRNVFKQLQPDKNGKFQISQFLFMLRKNHSGFDYKKLGYENGPDFVSTLPEFEVYENKYLKLKR